MRQIKKKLAIASLVAAVLVPLAGDAQAWWGGTPWGGGSRGYPGYGGGANNWGRSMGPWSNPWGSTNRWSGGYSPWG
ncbi:MAG: hypothetical protein H6R11_2356, partial [Proteobacteria bacterium]|nr:hypothetical protein [Pseudomonadota bacterium]